MDCTIKSLQSIDIRYPTSLTLDGSDAVHKNPDYSCAYVIIDLEGSAVQGHGFTFTIGRGTEIVVQAINAYKPFVLGRKLSDITNAFGKFWVELLDEEQLRWLGPEKGVVHLACAAILNAIWDLWAKVQKKPLWKLIADLSPEELISCLHFRHITDALTPKEALHTLQKNQQNKHQNEQNILEGGVPAYITSAGWMGYDDTKIRTLAKAALADGWTRFKMKVGGSLEDDMRRAKVIRDTIGYDNLLMMDANQVWDVQQTVSNMHHLAQFQPLWIEEPTSPDDVDGHLTISQSLSALGIGVATGEHCQNRVLFKQFIRRHALQFAQIDACRLASVNECILVMLMACKYNVPVCPHAGGVGLCELVQHLSIINYICIAPHWNNVMVEYAGHLHEHMVDPVQVKHGKYIAPRMSGYSCAMKEASISQYRYPDGSYWAGRN